MAIEEIGGKQVEQGRQPARATNSVVLSLTSKMAPACRACQE